MSGIDLRLGRLFDRSSGRAFVVAFDHGQAFKIPHGLGNPVRLLERIVDGGPEGVLLNPGMLRQAGRLFAARQAPAPILRVDWTTLDPEMRAEQGEAHRRLISPADALALGAEACCVYLIARPAANGMFADNVASVSATIAEAHRVGLPVIVEATLWGGLNKDQRDPDQLRHVCRIAAELGADAIKTEHVGDVGAQKSVIAEVGDIPVLTLGGAAASSEDVERAAAEAIEAGAKGLIFGRNVWARPDPEAAIARLAGIVHDRRTP